MRIKVRCALNNLKRQTKKLSRICHFWVVSENFLIQKWLLLKDRNILKRRKEKKILNTDTSRICLINIRKYPNPSNSGFSVHSRAFLLEKASFIQLTNFFTGVERLVELSCRLGGGWLMHNNIIKYVCMVNSDNFLISILCCRN